LTENGWRSTEPNERLIELLEKQKRELVVRVLRKHEEVRREKGFTDRLIANLSDLFFVVDEKFAIVKANEGFCLSLGVPPNKVTELHLSRVMTAEGLEAMQELLKKGEFKDFETDIRTRAGDLIRVSLNSFSLTTDSGRTLHMMIASDKSDAYKMMLRIREAQEQLIHSGRLASLGEMAAGIGHELTQPLNAILLFARNCTTLLENPESNKELLRENLSIIIDRVNKASSIIKSLKIFARKVEEEIYPVDVNIILTNILRFLESQLKLSDIEVLLYLDRDPPLVLGHEVRLEQVFLNIIQNAVQAMGDMEFPKLEIRTFVAKGIETESLSEKKYVVTAIRDNGAGMTPEVQARIFDPFFTTRDVGLGMGLGLSIVDRIVLSLSGFIKVESALGQGSCFSVYLPVYDEEVYEQKHYYGKKPDLGGGR